MTRKRVIVFAIVLAIIFAMLAMFVQSRNIVAKKRSPYQISVIIRGKNTEDWTTIWQGIEQASRDLNVESSSVYLSSENNASEQIDMLKREENNGADAILIAPVNSEDLMEPIARCSVPVVSFESTVERMDGLPYVGCDNYALGEALAYEIANREGLGKKVVVARYNLGCSSINQRFYGLIDKLSALGAELLYCDMPNPLDARVVSEAMADCDSCVVAALDSASLETVSIAARDGGFDAAIYGVGRSNNVVSMLEDRVITSVGVQNEFNIGYLAVQRAVEILDGLQRESSLVNFAIVNNEDMYSKENQRLLFPLVR